MSDTIKLSRRHVLAGGAGMVAATALMNPSLLANAQDVKPAEPKPLPEYVKWKPADALIIHSEQTIEMKRSAFGTSIITPEEKLYIRNNVKAPDASFVADRDGWQVSFEGVKNPKTLTVAELKGMGLTTVATVLQCSGNGRSYFQEKVKGTDKKISGTPWTVGAAGCVIWSGVPLKAVVEALGGPVSGAKFITGTGGEKIPEGVNPKDVMVERSVPIKTLDNVILAWEINGNPISLAHGGPLRMIVPGYTGVNNVKYVKAVSLTEKETDAKIQASGYRMHGVGEKGVPTHPSVWEMNVKSWVTSPLTDTKSGKVQITGVAFGGMNAAESVEVSVDGGQSWKKAKFVGPDLGKFAWRQFVLSTDLKPGSYNIVSRATDSKGSVQPKDTKLNGGGYSYNGWIGPAVKLTVA